MERLTTRIAGTATMAFEHEEMHTLPEWLDIVHARLADYEDTGLTPEQIKMLASGTCEKIAQELVEVLPQMVQAVVENLPRLVEQAVNKIAGEIEEGQA